jgi:ubiquinone biosynthesis protein
MEATIHERPRTADHRPAPVVNRLVLGVMTAALIVGSSLSWSMKAPPTLGGVSVVGAAGYFVAAYLGWRLVRAIKKSGDINSKQ